MWMLLADRVIFLNAFPSKSVFWSRYNVLFDKNPPASITLFEKSNPIISFETGRPVAEAGHTAYQGQSLVASRGGKGCWSMEPSLDGVQQDS
jgi:hypothetical protein